MRKKKHKQDEGRRSKQASASAFLGVGAETARVESLLAAGRYRDALERARELHKRAGTPKSEELLLECYEGRIGEMLSAGLAQDAYALAGTVMERFPHARGRFETVCETCAIRAGRLSLVLDGLADPGCGAERLETAAGLLKRELRDPAHLARCDALPPDHPWRLAAAAVCAAFDSVTSGAADAPAALAALAAVPRRSPLAPWKALVLAIDAMHAGRTEECRQWLDMIGSGTAPAMAAGVIRTVCGDGGRTGTLPPSAQSLLAALRGPDYALAPLLESVDAALQRHDIHAVNSAVREVTGYCRVHLPQLLREVAGRLAVCLHKAGVNPVGIPGFFGGCFILSTSALRTMAAIEQQLDPVNACAYWHQYMKHAIHDGILEDGGVEQAAIRRHMAGLLQGRTEGKCGFMASPRMELCVPGLKAMYKGQPAGVVQAGGNLEDVLGNADRIDILMAQAVKADPSSEYFEFWIDVARQAESEFGHPFCDTTPHDVAERWAARCPNDVKPLLLMARWAERKKAFRKASGYLDLAEKVDPLNLSIRCGRASVTISIAVKHLAAGKFGLAAEDLDSLSEIVSSLADGYKAVYHGLRAVYFGGVNDEARAGESYSELVRVAKSDISARIVLNAVAALAKRRELLAGYPMPGPGASPGELARAAAEAYRLADEGSVTCRPGRGFAERVRRDLEACGGALAAEPLCMLAENALRAVHTELVYSATAAGLRHHPAKRGLFLMLRARCLDHVKEPERVLNCYAAAAILLRQAQEKELMSQAMENAVGLAEYSSHIEPSEPYEWLHSPECVPVALRVADEEMELPWGRMVDARQIEDYFPEVVEAAGGGHTVHRDDFGGGSPFADDDGTTGRMDNRFGNDDDYDYDDDDDPDGFHGRRAVYGGMPDDIHEEIEDAMMLEELCEASGVEPELIARFVEVADKYPNPEFMPPGLMDKLFTSKEKKKIARFMESMHRQDQEPDFESRRGGRDEKNRKKRR